jgi:hypothetical protein
MYLDRKQITKSSTNREHLTASGRHFSIDLTFKTNSETDRMLACGTPISWLYASDKQVPTRIL